MKECEITLVDPRGNKLLCYSYKGTRVFIYQGLVEASK